MFQNFTCITILFQNMMWKLDFWFPIRTRCVQSEVMQYKSIFLPNICEYSLSAVSDFHVSGKFKKFLLIILKTWHQQNLSIITMRLLLNARYHLQFCHLKHGKDQLFWQVYDQVLMNIVRKIVEFLWSSAESVGETSKIHVTSTWTYKILWQTFSIRFNHS